LYIRVQIELSFLFSLLFPGSSHSLESGNHNLSSRPCYLSPSDLPPSDRLLYASSASSASCFCRTVWLSSRNRVIHYLRCVAYAVELVASYRCSPAASPVCFHQLPSRAVLSLLLCSHAFWSPHLITSHMICHLLASLCFFRSIALLRYAIVYLIVSPHLRLIICCTAIASCCEWLSCLQ